MARGSWLPPTAELRGAVLPSAMPPMEIAAAAESLDPACLNCISTMDRPTEEQQMMMIQTASEKAELCDDQEHSRSRLAEAAALVAVGVFGGLYRERIQASLLGRETGGGGRGTSLTCWSFGLHCCPLTHQLALCQEARAISASRDDAAAVKAPVAVD